MVDILLATYNGEKYLSEQLDSILKQSCRDFRIIIHDDGSEDNTVNIIKKYTENNPDRIVFIDDNVRTGSSAGNFMYLTKFASSDYVMYCDQDDYWLEDKISITLQKMKETEVRSGNEKPVLVFSSYRAVDEKLENEISGVNSVVINTDLNRLIVQNCVTGCLIMANRALYSIMGDYSEDIIMHDWWLALIAAAMGEICYISDVMTLYRQHANNIVGAENVKSLRYRISKMTDPDTRALKYKYRDQAFLLLKRYGGRLEKEKYDIIKGYIELFSYTKIIRIHKLVKGRYLKSDLVRAVGQLLYI